MLNLLLTGSPVEELVRFAVSKWRGERIWFVQVG